LDISCIVPCKENEASPLEPWTPPTPGGGGLDSVTTADSTSVSFSGDGTAESPLTANVEGNIEFEIAMARTTGFSADEIIFGYSTAKGFTLPSPQPDASVAHRGLSGDFRVDLYKEADAIGYVEVVGGVSTVNIPADVVFAAHELLEFRAVGAVSFTLLAITLIGVRAITFV
jgi:hypothetical protein